MRDPLEGDVIMIVLEQETPRFDLLMSIVPMGKDLCVSLSGGDVPHIGAVAMAVPHPGLRTPGKIDASVSMLCVTGHKEDSLARKVAFTLATLRNCTVSVSCGIHLEHGIEKEITDVLQAADALLERAIRSMKSSR